jgi:uncharacterized protein YcaQ
MIELSKTQAKRLVISRQGLHKANAFGRGESAILNCINRLNYIQIDTISVVERAHHHTIWTRIPKYDVDQLDSLQRCRRIFEYWSHAAAYLPMEDYRFCLPHMNAIASGQKHWRTPDKKAMKMVMDRVKAEGALKARDFDAPKSMNTKHWGGMKPAKIALEQLFIEGKLMISHRDRFQKVFDLPERVLPAGLNTSTPSTDEFFQYLIERTIQSQGIATESEMGYLRKRIKPQLKKQIQRMLTDNKIVEVSVQDNPNTYYSVNEIIEQASSVRVAKKVRLLSPFDNLVIQRKRVSHLFDFDYQIECYVTEAKRVHGYFCLPILFGEELVGRLDPKADRKTNELIIRNLVIEKEIANIDLFATELAKAIRSFAAFNVCDRISIKRNNHKKIAAKVSRHLA